VEELKPNNKNIEILTDTGWSKFDAVAVKGIKSLVAVKLQYSSIILTPDHIVFDYLKRPIPAASLKPQMKISTLDGIQQVVSVTGKSSGMVYDLINVEKNNRFYANNILVSNCEFLIFDETLISASTLIELEGREPTERQGQIRWYHKPEPGRTYIVSLDPSLGTGGDPAAIQVLEMPACRQVAEWQHNKTPVPGQINIVKEITNYIYECTKRENDIYYSVENNTLGEAALICINELGEENIRGIFLSEPARIGSARRYRKGFTTTNKSKLAVCAKLKTMIESKKMTISSKNLVSELKNFVASANNSFAAKIGETDDLVTSLLLAVRMMQVLQSFDPEIDNQMRDTFEEFITPMPFIMVS